MKATRIRKMQVARVAMATMAAAMIIAAVPAMAAAAGEYGTGHTGDGQWLETPPAAQAEVIPQSEEPNDADLGDQPGDENIIEEPEPEVEPEPEPGDNGWHIDPCGPETRVLPPRKITKKTTKKVPPTVKRHTKGHRAQLAYTGGNENAYRMIGLLTMLAGAAVLMVRKPAAQRAK